jgi:hypothetical protein
MRNVLSCVVAAAALAGLSYTTPAFAEDSAQTATPTPAAAATPAPSTAAEPSGNGNAITPKDPHGLTRIHGALGSEATTGAGTARNVEVSVGPTTSGKLVRPAPSPRVLRRLGAERAMATVDPNVRACASESSSPAPVTFALRVSIGPGGEVENAELASGTAVAPALLACVVKAVSGARFGSPGATGAAIAVPVQVPPRPQTNGQGPKSAPTPSAPTAVAGGASPRHVPTEGPVAQK